jgi:hypothetical protein
MTWSRQRRRRIDLSASAKLPFANNSSGSRVLIGGRLTRPSCASAGSSHWRGVPSSTGSSRPDADLSIIRFQSS